MSTFDCIAGNNAKKMPKTHYRHVPCLEGRVQLSMAARSVYLKDFQRMPHLHCGSFALDIPLVGDSVVAALVNTVPIKGP